jgi:hypothetical protein
VTRRILDDATLSGLAANPVARAEFPFLAAASSGAAQAACCGGVAGGASWGTARQAVAGLPPVRLALFKRLLGAATVELYVADGGRTTRLVL